MHYVYFLKLSNEDIYKGRSSKLQRRIKEHKNGKVESTKHKRPLKLIGYEAYLRKSDAVRREKFLKTSDGRKSLYRQYRDVIEESVGT